MLQDLFAPRFAVQILFCGVLVVITVYVWIQLLVSFLRSRRKACVPLSAECPVESGGCEDEVLQSMARELSATNTVQESKYTNRLTSDWGSFLAFAKRPRRQIVN